MTTTPNPTGRQDPPHSGPERAILEGFLDYRRATLLWKCSGLTDEQLTTRACEPSSLTLLGLVRHVHMIEEYARHNGHADLLRERIDGATGE